MELKPFQGPEMAYKHWGPENDPWGPISSYNAIFAISQSSQSVRQSVIHSVMPGFESFLDLIKS